METAEAYYSRGQAHFQKKEFILALADFNAAISLNPYNGSEDYTDWHHVRGLAYYMIAVSNRDADYRSRVARGESIEEAYVQSRLALSNDRLLNRALSDFTVVIGLAPHSYRAYYLRGQTLLAKMKRDHAIADYNTAISINSQFAAAYINRGNAYAEKKEYRKAISDFSAYIRLGTGKNKDRGYYKRGRAYYFLGEYDRSLDDLETALRVNPNNGQAYDLQQHMIRQPPFTRATGYSGLRHRPKEHGESWQDYANRRRGPRRSDDVYAPSDHYYDSDPYDSMAVNYESEYGEGYGESDYGDFGGDF